MIFSLYHGKSPFFSTIWENIFFPITWRKSKDSTAIYEPWNSKQSVFNGCLVISNHFPSKGLESSKFKWWLFRVSGRSPFLFPKKKQPSTFTRCIEVPFGSSKNGFCKGTHIPEIAANWVLYLESFDEIFAWLFFTGITELASIFFSRNFGHPKNVNEKPPIIPSRAPQVMCFAPGLAKGHRGYLWVVDTVEVEKRARYGRMSRDGSGWINGERINGLVITYL